MGKRIARGLAGAMAAIFVAWSVALGCSSSSSSSPPPDAATICPNTVQEANGAHCPRDGFQCWLGFPCPPFNQQAECTCKNGSFQCTDQVQGTIPAGGSPQCKPTGGANDQQCPAGEANADNAACMTPGLLCFYAGLMCPGAAVPFTDECQCIGRTMPDAGNRLVYNCERQLCNPTADAAPPPLPEAAPPPDVTEASSEAGD
jgi:hypothetical protein